MGKYNYLDCKHIAVSLISQKRRKEIGNQTDLNKNCRTKILLGTAVLCSAVCAVDYRLSSIDFIPSSTLKSKNQYSLF
jgi:hypothetical protein